MGSFFPAGSAGFLPQRRGGEGGARGRRGGGGKGGVGEWGVKAVK